MWTDDAKAKVQHAIDEWTSKHPRSASPIQIVWGGANKEEEQEEQQYPEPFRQQDSLLRKGDRYYRLFLSQSGDPDYPDCCNISTGLFAEDGLEEDGLEDDDLTLPLWDAKKLYNVLACLQDRIKLSLLPVSGSEPAILVVGVSVVIPVESLSGRVLGDALLSLKTSANLVRDWLVDNEGDDHWRMDGGN